MHGKPSQGWEGNKVDRDGSETGKVKEGEVIRVCYTHSQTVR